MLINYVEPKKEILLSEQDKKSTEHVLQLKENMKNHVNDFTILHSQLNESKLLNAQEMKKLEQTFFMQMHTDIRKYNQERDALFLKLKHKLPEDLVESYEISQNKVVPVVDPIGFLGNYSEVKISNLRKYIEENQLVMFPYEFLKSEKNNLEVTNVVETANRVEKGSKAYVIGTLNNIDLFKILNGKKFDMNQCIFSSASETLMMSFMFQLPLLQTMNEEIKAIKQNNGTLKSKITDLQDNLEKFINHQFKINQTFNQKIYEIITNVNRLDEESYSVRENERRRNPTMQVEDTSIILQGEYIDYDAEDGVENSFWGNMGKVVKYYYHPIITVNRPDTIRYNIAHIKIDNNLPKFNINKEIKLEAAKDIVLSDLKSNFVCLLVDDINNNKEKAKVLCTFGTGYQPLTQLTFTQDKENQAKNKPTTSKRGIK
jgi:hypothetical protein